MEDLFPLLIFGVVVVFSIGGAIHRRGRWKEAAEKLGLTFSSGLLGGGHLSGDYKGLKVRIYTVTRGGKNNRKTYTIYEVTPPEAFPLGLKMTPENMLASLGKFFGAQDVEVGLSILDSTFVIKASRPEEARAFLVRPGVEDALLEVYGSFGNLKVEDGAAIVENYGTDQVFEMEITLDALAGTLGKLGLQEEPSPPSAAQPDLEQQPSQSSIESARKFGPSTSGVPKPDEHVEPASAGADDDWW